MRIVLLFVAVPVAALLALPHLTVRVTGHPFRPFSLHYAAAKHDLTMLKFLIRMGKDLDEKDPWYGRTALHYSDSYQTCGILLEAGANPDIVDDEGYTPLDRAAGSGGSFSPGNVKLLLQYGADPNHRSKAGSTPLHYVLYVASARDLINAGADVDAQDSEGRTPLYSHMGGYRTDIVARLLSKGANPNIPDNQWRTPLDKDLQHIRQIEMSNPSKPAEQRRKLLEKEIDLLKQHGAKTGAELMIEAVVSGADPNQLDERGMAFMHYAAKHKDPCDLLTFLIAHGGDINLKSGEGETPLHYAWNKKFVKDLGGY